MLLNDLGQPDFGVLAVAFAAGVGMLLGGAAELLLGRARVAVRVGAAGLACAAAAAGAWLVAGAPAAGAVAAGLTAAGLAAAAAARGVTAAAAAVGRRPAARWGGLAAAGLAVAVAAVVWYDLATEAAADRTADELAAISERPPVRPAAAHPTTDRGHPVAVMEATDPRARAELAAVEARVLDNDRTNVIRRQPADDRTNCHGWVFTGGRFWVAGSEVETILADNGYRPVSDPRPGDLVIYRQNGAVAHTALVRYVTPDMPVLVEGKWGATGVYIHAVEQSVYGSEFTYYRGARPTHVLAGLDAPPVHAGAQ